MVCLKPLGDHPVLLDAQDLLRHGLKPRQLDIQFADNSKIQDAQSYVYAEEFEGQCYSLHRKLAKALVRNYDVLMRTPKLNAGDK